MAKIKNGIFGQVSGKLGKTVFYERKGVQIAQQASKGQPREILQPANSLRVTPQEWAVLLEAIHQEFLTWAFGKNLNRFDQIARQMQLNRGRNMTNRSDTTPKIIVGQNDIAGGVGGLVNQQTTTNFVGYSYRRYLPPDSQETEMFISRGIISPSGSYRFGATSVRSMSNPQTNALAKTAVPKGEYLAWLIQVENISKRFLCSFFARVVNS